MNAPLCGLIRLEFLCFRDTLGGAVSEAFS